MKTTTPKLKPGTKFAMGRTICTIQDVRDCQSHSSDLTMPHYLFSYHTDAGRTMWGFMPVQFVEDYTGFYLVVPEFQVGQRAHYRTKHNTLPVQIISVEQNQIKVQIIRSPSSWVSTKVLTLAEARERLTIL